MASNVKAEPDEKTPPGVVSSRPEEEVVAPPQPMISYDGTVVRVVTETHARRSSYYTPEGGWTEKEPDANSGQSAGAPIKADPVKSEDATATPPPSKKAKVEKGPFLEIRWYKDYEDTGGWQKNGTYRSGELREHYYSIFADEIPKRTKFNRSCVFAEGEFREDKEGENHEYRLSMCLVDSKAEDRKVLVEIRVYYWILPINLMHFHILSQDLANLSRKLWVAAGRNEDVYDDMSIEFGYCKNGKVTVKSLVSKAMGIRGKSDVLYVQKVKMHEGASGEDSKKLIDMMFRLCTSAIVIVYEVDLKGLCVNDPGTPLMMGLKKMPNFNCFIGPNRKF